MLIEKGSWSLLAKIGTSLLRMSLFHSCFFTHFASKDQLPGFSTIGILVENRLRKRYVLIYYKIRA